MPGGFTSRWVCGIKEGLTLTPDRIKEKDGHIWSGEGEKFKLKRLLKLTPPIEYEKGLIISGIMYFQRELFLADYEITEKGEIKEIQERHIIRVTDTVPFWVSFGSSPIIMFKNSKDYTRNGMKILSLLLFQIDDGIHPVEFDIRAIEDAWRRGEFNMWAYSFENRSGTVNSGTHYSQGIIDINDPLYQDTIGAPRNFVGIYVNFGDRDVKIRISRNGSIMIYGGFEEMRYQPAVTEFIRDLVAKFKL